MQTRNAQVALTLIRVAAALLIAIHGWHRIINGDEAGLGAAIARHTPLGDSMGLFLGWAVTIFEAFGAPVFAAGRLIASGRLVFPLGLVFMTIYATAAYIYHAPHGWFSSGTDQDGAEYAVLLVAAFTCVTIAHLPSRFFPSVANAAGRI